MKFIPPGIVTSPVDENTVAWLIKMNLIYSIIFLSFLFIRELFTSTGIKSNKQEFMATISIDCKDFNVTAIYTLSPL